MCRDNRAGELYSIHDAMSEELKWKIGMNVDGDQYWLTLNGLKKGENVIALHWWELNDVVDIITRWRQDDMNKIGTIELWLVRRDFADLLVANWTPRS